LAAEGAEIRALARPNADRSALAELDVTWVEGDVTVPGSLRGFFEGADWVIHAAGMLGQAGVPEPFYHRLHVDGTRHVLAEAAETRDAADGRPRVLYVSSPGVLGPITGPPADETAPLAPSNPYERSKAAAEQVARQFAEDGLPVIIARPEFIYGPGDRHVLDLFRAIQRGLFFYVGNGRHTCHPTFIDDAVDGMLRCLQRGRLDHVYHITGPGSVTFRQLATTMAQALQVPPPRLVVPRWLAWLAAAGLELVGTVTGKAPPLSRSGVAFFSEDRRFSWQKANRELGYTPQVDLETGVRRTVAWYKEKGLL
jgi:nucleoside-diphosphate-sugar epimerase